MRRTLRWLVGLLVVGTLVSLAAWAFVESRRELERERQLERPAEAPRRLFRLATGETAVRIAAAAQQRMGLEVRGLELATSPCERIAYGRVLDPRSLIALCNELAAGEVSVAASRAEYERLRSLYERSRNASRHDLESAEARFRSDELRVRTAQRCIVDEWGPSFADLDRASREEFLDRLVSRQTALIQVNLPGGETLPNDPTGATIAVFGNDDLRLEADAVFPAPRTDATLQGQAFLLRTDAPGRALRPGTSVTGHLQLAGSPRSSLVVPRAAVIRFEGRTWVYVRDQPERFVRRAIALDQPTEAGWLTREGLSEADQVVVVGAQLLLSEELRTEIEVEDEGEE